MKTIATIVALLCSTTLLGACGGQTDQQAEANMSQPAADAMRNDQVAARAPANGAPANIAGEAAEPATPSAPERKVTPREPTAEPRAAPAKAAPATRPEADRPATTPRPVPKAAPAPTAPAPAPASPACAPEHRAMGHC